MLMDMHAHVVYGVDDGAQTIEDSMDLLHGAYEQGVRVVVCTSHITPGHRSLNIERYLDHLDELIVRAKDELPGMMLYSGSEILYTEATAGLLSAGQVPTLGGTNKVLIEFFPDVTYDVLYRAAMDVGFAGFIPVFAHVERYDCLREDITRLEKLKRDGRVLAQMNADVVLRNGGLMGSRWVKRALREGLIDVVASDMHHIKTRPCRMGDAYKVLSRLCTAEYADEVCWQTPSSLLGE